MGKREGEGETGIPQIDEEILFERGLIDKCRHGHKSGHINIRKKT